MPARLTAFVPDQPAESCLLQAGQCLRIGRSPGCDFVVTHASVSREHAQISWQDGTWRLFDQDSKNGSFLDGVRCSAAILGEHAWLRLGEVMCEFDALSAEAAERIEQRHTLRRANSMVLIDGLAQQTALPGLLQETVRAAVQLADGERGFLLLYENGELRVAAGHGLDPAALRSREFHGSVGAVQRALASREPVVVHDLSRDSELAGRASVIAGGLGALVCLPLMAGADPLGLLYVDSRRAGSVITSMDVQLLRAFADRAALWISARRGAEALAELARPAESGWSEIVAAQRMASA
jgi:hypothetical protein